MTRQSLVLLGDSILDNGTYTHPQPDTTAHLSELLAPRWSVKRLAVDGAKMWDLHVQIDQLRDRPSQSVLSIGGNDLTQHLGILERRQVDATLLFDHLMKICEGFGRHYEASARAVAERSERTLLCTIYEVQLEPPSMARLVRAPLALINDQIIRIGARLGLDVLELRSVCTEPDDFVLQIEPSAQGAEKIAHAIADAVDGKGGLRCGRTFSA